MLTFDKYVRLGKIFMNRVLLIALLVFSGFLHAQTWITSPSFETPLPSSINPDTETVGPIEIRATNDGNIITTMQINQNHEIWLLKYDSLGHLIWHFPVAFNIGSHIEWIHSLNTTVDNGCVYAWQYVGSSYQDSVVRRGANGHLIWQKNFSNGMNNNEVILSIAQSFYNTTFIQFYDSLVEVDSSGAFIRQRSPFSYSKKIVALPDSNLLVIDSGFIRKENFNGASQWIVNSGYSESAFCRNSPFIYVNDNTSVKKISTLNGNVIWIDTISVNTITTTSDEGFAALNGDQLLKYDSSGILQWPKHIDFPRYALRGLVELPDKNYITGGCWMMNDLHYYERYNPFITRLDSIGNGVIDSTDNYFTANANDNNILSFADDAVYMAAALGTIGTPRDVILECDTSNNCPLVAKSVFGTDWSTGFTSGINHKFSDVNGDGVIDTLDIIQFSNSLWNGGLPELVSPHWFRQTGSVPELRFDIRNTQITNNDSLVVDVILGTGSIPIDSIYGLSTQSWFTFNSMMPHANVSPAFSVPISELGDSLTNLYTFIDYDSAGVYCGNTKIVLCRNDHQNVYVTGDTIARLTYDLSTLPNTSDTLHLTAYANAITVGGFQVPLSIVTDWVVMSAITSTGNLNIGSLTVYPNPVNDALQIDYRSDGLNKILLYDCIGRPVMDITDIGSKGVVDVRKLSSGIYILKCMSDGNVVTRKIIVKH
jgi:hypothetical protein